MTNFLMKYEAKKILAAIRLISGHRMAHYEYLGCQISSKKKYDGVFEITYLFSWQILPKDEEFQFKISLETKEEILHRATNYVYDDETARQMRGLYVLLRKFIPVQDIYSDNKNNVMMQEIESSVIRAQHYYKYGILINY